MTLPKIGDTVETVPVVGEVVAVDAPDHHPHISHYVALRLDSGALITVNIECLDLEEPDTDTFALQESVEPVVAEDY